jgi:hypothetical protein
MTNICFSGGAKGSDLVWGAAADFLGHQVVHFSFEGHKRPNEQSQFLKVLNREQLAEAEEHLKKANKTLKRKWPVASISTANLLRRNFHQIVTTERVYAISTFEDGQVAGGTAWAVQMFIDRHHGEPCEAYVFDQDNNQWFKWHGVWVDIKFPPVPHGAWTGIGTRDINKNGLSAVKNLFEQDEIPTKSHKSMNITKAQGSQMFQVNDAVWIKASELKGVISYMEDGYVEIELENGAEVSFDNTSGLEVYTGQTATPKQKPQSWSELFQQRIDDAS